MVALCLAATVLLAGCITSGLAGPPGGDGNALDAASPADHPLAPYEAPVPIAANRYADFETHVAVHPYDADHVAVLYMEIPGPVPTGSTFTSPVLPGMFVQVLATSRDGGATWKHAVMPHTGAAPLGSAWAAYCVHGDPSIGFDADGVLHAWFLAMSCSAPGYVGVEAILHASTADDGATWSEPHVVAVTAGGVLGLFHDRPWGALDLATGHMGVAWTRLEAGLQRTSLMAAFSLDGGATWTLPEEVESGLTLVDGRNWLVHTAWGADGRFHASGLGGERGSLVHWTGGPGAAWQGADLDVEGCAGAPWNGTFAYATSAVGAADGPDAGRVWVATPVTAGNERGVCVWTSADHGASWPVGTYLPHADHPWLAASPRGGAALAYLSLDPDDADLATPTLALLDGATLAAQAIAAMGPVHDLRAVEGGQPYAHYDAMAATGDGFLWALTVPDLVDADPYIATDVLAYRVAWAAP